MRVHSAVAGWNYAAGFKQGEIQRREGIGESLGAGGLTASVGNQLEARGSGATRSSSADKSLTNR